MLGEKVIFTIDPENIRAILSTKGGDYSIGRKRKSVLVPIFGHGILTTDGVAWSHRRRLIRPNFTVQQVSDLSVAEKNVDRLIDIIPGGSTVDLQELFSLTLLDIMTQAFCGLSTSCLGSESQWKAGRSFPLAFNNVQITLRNCMYFGRPPFWAPFTAFRNHRDHVSKFVDELV